MVFAIYCCLVIIAEGAYHIIRLGWGREQIISFLVDFYFLMNINEEVNILADLMNHAVYANSLQIQEIILTFKSARRIQ